MNCSEETTEKEKNTDSETKKLFKSSLASNQQKHQKSSKPLIGITHHLFRSSGMHKELLTKMRLCPEFIELIATARKRFIRRQFWNIAYIGLNAHIGSFTDIYKNVCRDHFG